MKRRGVLNLLAFLLAAATITRGQTPGQEQRPSESIRVETALVSVPVIVTDRQGYFVSGLTARDFRVFEDDKVQEIASFSSTEAPFQVALLIDTSRSTRNRLGAIRKAVLNFIKQLQPQDRVLIATFDERVHFLGDFTSDRSLLRRTVDAVKSSYLTCLYDAIHLTITEKFAGLRGRKAIVVFSDGVDTWSRQATYDSSLDLIARSGVLTYAVQYETRNAGGPVSSPWRLPSISRFSSPSLFSSPASFTQTPQQRLEEDRYLTATRYLQSIASQSGARHLQAENIESSERAFALIAGELRHQYTLEYYSSNDRSDAGQRRIAVRLQRKDLEVRARQGYRAPGRDTTR